MEFLQNTNIFQQNMRDFQRNMNSLIDQENDLLDLRHELDGDEFADNEFHCDNNNSMNDRNMDDSTVGLTEIELQPININDRRSNRTQSIQNPGLTQTRGELEIFGRTIHTMRSRLDEMSEQILRLSNEVDSREKMILNLSGKPEESNFIDQLNIEIEDKKNAIKKIFESQETNDSL